AARTEGRTAPRLSVAVRRDAPFRAPSLLDEHSELLHRELLVDRVIRLAHDPSRCAHLDHPGAQAELVPHPSQALGDAVAQLDIMAARLQGPKVRRRKHAEVAMARGGAEHRA